MNLTFNSIIDLHDMLYNPASISLSLNFFQFYNRSSEGLPNGWIQWKQYFQFYNRSSTVNPPNLDVALSTLSIL